MRGGRRRSTARARNERDRRLPGLDEFPVDGLPEDVGGVRVGPDANLPNEDGLQGTESARCKWLLR